MRHARELDPLFAMSHALSSQVAFQARADRAALDHARQATVVDPEFWVGYIMLGQAYVQLEETDLASKALADAARLSGGNSKPISFRGYLLARAGRTSEARDVLKTLEEMARDRYVPPYATALVLAGLGDREAVFDWLDRAYAVRDVHLIYLPVDSKWDAYRADPRFQALLARCGFSR
jgi:Flp pilus assembly protein TadD